MGAFNPQHKKKTYRCLPYPDHSKKPLIPNRQLPLEYISRISRLSLYPNTISRLLNVMESFGTEFPGFQTLAPRDEFVVTRKPPLSRLQRRAPCPLQLKPASSECRSAVKSIGGNKESSSSSSAGTSTVGSYFSSKDPIPLLSPLVLPSMLETPVIQQETMAKSH